MQYAYIPNYYVPGTHAAGETVPDAPTLSVTDNGDGSSVTAAVTGTGTITVYGRPRTAGTSWASLGQRSGDGDVACSGLTAGATWDFYATATAAGLTSGPSSVQTLFVPSAVQSVLERIAEQVLDTVTGVTETAGYQVTVSPRRPTRMDWQDVNPLDKKAILVLDGQREAEEPAVNTDDRVATFAVYVLSMPAESDTTAAETYCNRIAAAITQAMLADWTRGGLAEDTTAAEDDRSQARDDEWPGVILKFDVHYRTRLGDPYTQI